MNAGTGGGRMANPRAGILMVLVGVFSMASGLFAILHGPFYAITEDGLHKFEITGWGWLELIVGVGVVIGGIWAMVSGSWSRRVGVTLTVVSAVTALLLFPYHPVWTILILVLDVAIIVAFFRRKVRPAGGTDG